jgi:membrane protein
MTESKLSTTEQVSSMWSLGGLTIGQLARKVVRGISEDVLLDRASALAYNFILALFPMLLFLLALLGVFVSRGSALRTNLMAYLSHVLPPAAFQVVTHTLTEVTKNAGGTKLTIGIVLALWFASNGMASMISALNGAYEVREVRAFIKVRLIALGLTIAVSILVIAALGAVLAGGYMANVVGSYYGLQQVVIDAWRVLQIVVAIAFITGVHSRSFTTTGQTWKSSTGTGLRLDPLSECCCGLWRPSAFGRICIFSTAIAGPTGHWVRRSFC